MAYPDPPTTPPVPQRGDRTTFSARVDAFLTWVVDIIPWLRGYIEQFMTSLSALSVGGANAFVYLFDAATGDVDPGPGRVRLGSTSQNTSTVVRLDRLTAGGVDIYAALVAMLSGSSSVKATMRMQKIQDPTAWMTFDITAYSGTGYLNMSVTPRASSGAAPFVANDQIAIFFDRTGDVGLTAAFPYMKVNDTKSVNINGGTSSSNTTSARTLNSIVINTISGASLASNTVTLPAGTYEVRGRAPTKNSGGNRLTIYSVTDSSVLIQGASFFNSTTGSYSLDAAITGRFTITSTKNIQLQHWISEGDGRGFGAPANQTGVLEIYSELELTKVS